MGYNTTTHTVTIQNDHDIAHSASYANASRVTTFLRPAVEQFHGAIFGTYKVNVLVTCISYLFYFFRFWNICHQVSSSQWVKLSLTTTIVASIQTGVESGLTTAWPTLSTHVWEDRIIFHILVLIGLHLPNFK